MATDSTNLPQGETTLDASNEMMGSDLDLTLVQEAAATEPTNFVDLPKGNTVILLPVQPGQTVKLPTDSADGVLAKIGPEGNLALVVDGRTIILQGFLKANDQSPVKLVTNDGDDVNVADLIAATDPSLDIQTAAGPASGDTGDTDGSGIYIPFLAGPGLGGILAEGILDPTALQYRLIDDEFKLFTEEEDTGPSDISITFDILGGIINEDDLPADRSDFPELALALVVKDQGNDGTGNDPFDTKDREPGSASNPPDTDDVDDVGGVDPDPEPLVTVATVKVNFGPDVPGTLWVDKTNLPDGLKSEGEEITYQVLPPSGGQGNGIVGFVDGNGNGKFDDEFTDRLVFDIKVQEDKSNSVFHVNFTLYDNIDNTPPDADKDGKADLLGADEQILDLPVKLTAKDSDGSTLSTIMHLGVEDDVPFFGEVHAAKGEGGIEITIDQRDADITHDETKDVDDGSDDQLEGDAQPWVQDAEDKVTGAGFGLPEGDSEGALHPIGVAQTQVMASFGADQATQEHNKNPEGAARNSIFGELEDISNRDGDGKADGENERPFELFMTVGEGADGAVETQFKNPGSDILQTAHLSIADQPTNTTVTWNGQQPPLQVFLHQVDAQTIIGYVIPPEGEESSPHARQVDIDGENGEAVFVLTIDDQGVMTYVQYHQLNHPDAGDGSNGTHDEPFQILAEDGSPLINVRISDYDGDHAHQPVNLVVEDDGPVFKDVCFTHGNGTVDEDYLGKVLTGPGNHDLDNLFGGGNGDDQILDGTSTSGKISFDFGADKPGHLSFGELVITDSKDLPVDITALKTADGNGITLKETTDGFGNIILTAYEDGTGDKVFTMTLDAEGGEIGEFEFELHQALQHPYTDSDLDNNDNPDSAFEDDFNFAFNVIATDIDKDTAQGTINIKVDDDSPTALDDHDEVAEGKTGGNLNIATGNVVTGGDAILLGKDSNFTFVPFTFGDGTPDLPGADRPYTISKLAHDGHNYTLSADGTEVLRDGAELTPPEGFDGKVLKITTEEGGTFEIVMISNTQSEVGEYRYTVPANADHDHDKHFGPETLAESKSYGDGATWGTKFALQGITLTAFNGVLASKTVDVNPKGTDLGEDYGGVGVSNNGDEPEVDHVGPDEKLQLEFATPTDNAKLLIGALFDGNQYDSGFQEILQWQVFDGGTLVASGQILGTDNGLVTLDIDTNGVDFDRIVLTPLNNGGGASANNSDFLLINVETCCPQDKFTETFDYTLRDSDGDEDTATISIDVKDTEPKITRQNADVKFLVDEDGIVNGNDNFDAGDKEEAHNVPTNAAQDDGIHKGKINLTPGVDPVTIELSVGDPSQPGNGDTGLDTVDGLNVLAAWDPATSTLVGYIAGTDPSDAANRVFTVKIDNHQTGEFTFTLLKPVEHPDSNPQLPNADENNPDLSFKINFQIEDSDCDVAYGTMTVTIDDDMPVISQGSGTLKLAVDESLDGNTIPNNAGDHPHNPGTRIEDDEDGAGLPGVLTGLGGVIGASKAGAAGLFSFQAGADGLQSAVYSLTIGGAGPVATNLVDTQDNTLISLFTNPDGTVRGISAGGHLVFAFSINAGTGEVSMAQYRAINHGAEEPAPGNHDEEKSLGAPSSPTAPALINLLSVTLTVTDKDNDTVSKTVDITNKVTFDDDGPSACIDKKHDNQVIHDESAGLQNDDQPNAGLPAVFINVGLIGWARSSDPVVTTFGSDFGTDGPGTSVLSLKVSGAGVDSGLDDTATGNNILLFQNGSIVEGRVQGSNELVFAVSLNQNGTVDVAQYRAIEHPNPNDDDEDVGLNSSALQAWVTITDKDGDSATASVDIGSRVRFDDDGPVADIDIKHDACIVLDESRDAAAGDGFPDGNANDEAGNVGGDIGYGTIAGNALFIDNSVYGTDGPGTKAYSLVVSNGTSSGLFDSETNATIRLYQVNATTIEGRPDVPGVDPVSFRVTIDPVTGNVTVSQFRAVEHDNAGSSASDHDESGSPEIMDLNKLFVRQTITDGDKDHDTDDIDLGKIIKFEDDGPIARNDVDALDPIAGDKFESQGNVITGAAVTTPGIDDGGTDTPWVISNLVGSKSSDGNPSGGFNVTGTYGSLSMNTSGQYTYNFDEANWSGKVPSGSTEVFTYTLKDSDGDTDTATLTIKMGEASVRTSAVVGVQGDDCAYEDTLTPLALTATPGTAGDKVTQIVLDDIPAGWTVDTSAIVISGGGALGGFSLVGDKLTIDITGAPAGAAITATLAIKAAADSDVDGNDLVVSATVVDGVVFATNSSTFDVEVDAVADGKGPGFGDDGDTDVLSVSISVEDDGSDGDTTFAANEIGTVKVGATFDDYKDGSEVHTVTIDAPAGFKFLSVDAGSLPAGVTVQSLTDGKVVLAVDSTDTVGPAGVPSFSNVLIDVQNVSAPSGTTVTFTATAKAVETNLSGEECTTANNEQTAQQTADATTFTNQIPIAYDDKKCGDEAAPRDVNLLLVFDNSGSMALDSGIPGLTKLQAAKQAAINLLNEFDAAGGDVRVMLVTFNSDSSRQETWLSLSDAIDAINAIPQSGGATNYEEAILDAISGFNDTDGRGSFATHDNLVYFLSDGEPTTGGNPDNTITDGTLTQWDNLLENPANQIDHVYAVGLGTAIPGGASNPNLQDVANPANDGTNETPNTVVVVDDLNDLSSTLTATVGSLIEGNVLDGSIENDDPQGPNPGPNNDPDFQGDGPAHVSLFQYDHPTQNGLDITVTWDGAGNLDAGDVTGGTNVVLNGFKVTFDTEFGRMTFDVSNGNFSFVAGPVDGGDKEEHFTYKITDSNGDQSNPADLTVCIDDKFVDLKPVTYDDVASGAEPAPKSVNLLLVFDNSGSMADPSGIAGTTKLQAAKQAAINLLNSYAATGGDVRVMLVTFNSDSGREETWLDLTAAIAAINAIPQSGGSTNYEEAILDAISGFNDTDGRGDFATHDNVVYFLSDGQPTTGGNADNSITDGTLASWDGLLENAANQIDHVYAVGLGSGIPDGANNPNLLDVANPLNNGVNETPNTVILVDDFNDLSATLTATVGTPIEGNILDGSNESDPDAPAANTPDFQGDGPAHLSFFEYDSANNDLDVKITWDGAGAVVVDGVADGKSTVINGKEVSFDTDHGRMTIDFSDGDFKFVPANISGGDKTEVFDYKIADSDGDVSNESTLKVTINNLPPVVSIGDTAVNEGGIANIQVNLSEPALAGGVTVNYQFQTKVGNTATAGTDYTVVTSSIFIPAGASSGLISVNALTDPNFEGNETYSVVITGVSAGYTVGDDTGLVTIHDTTTLTVPVVLHDTQDPGTSGWPDGTSGSLFDNNVNKNDNVTGTSGDDGYEGENGDDTINGANGNDHLRGETGNDSLIGGSGSDFLEGDDNNDTLNGGTGNDLLSGDDGNDTVNGGDNADELQGDKGNDVLHGDAGNDLINGGNDSDQVFGDDGNDELFGGSGSDTLNGGNNNDYLHGDDDGSLDKLIGGAGDDWLSVEGNDLGAGRQLDGGSGNDVLDVSGSDLIGGAGITGIEIISMEGKGNNDDVSLNALDVVNVSGGSLIILGDGSGGANDETQLTGGGWSQVGDNVSGTDGRTYDVFQNGAAKVFVDTDVDVQLS